MSKIDFQFNGLILIFALDWTFTATKSIIIFASPTMEDFERSVVTVREIFQEIWISYL